MKRTSTLLAALLVGIVAVGSPQASIARAQDPSQDRREQRKGKDVGREARDRGEAMQGRDDRGQAASKRQAQANEDNARRNAQLHERAAQQQRSQEQRAQQQRSQDQRLRAARDGEQDRRNALIDRGPERRRDEHQRNEQMRRVADQQREQASRMEDRQRDQARREAQARSISPPGDRGAREQATRADRRAMQDSRGRERDGDWSRDRDDSRWSGGNRSAPGRALDNRNRELQAQRIREDRSRVAAYQAMVAQREAAERQRYAYLQQQQRIQQYRYQQDYYRRLRAEQARWNARQYDDYSDPYYYTPANYRYQRDGRYYNVNSYAADVLRQAIRYGYQEGYRAGRADTMDGWRSDYRNAFAYRDGNYGYFGRYVSQGEYNHYFREGFRRGYSDGHGRSFRYGSYTDGTSLILQSVLSSILGLQRL